MRSGGADLERGALVRCQDMPGPSRTCLSPAMVRRLRSGECNMGFHRILVATDLNECSRAAVDTAIDLATLSEATLTLVHVYELPAYGYAALDLGELVRAIATSADAQLGEELRRTRERLPAAKSLVKCGVPWEQILGAASESSADLIVVGSHGRKGVSRALLGSVAERVVRLASVAVLTVHGTRA